MPAEAATDVADISHRLDMAADGFVADTQCHAEGDTLRDILRDTIIQVRHNDRKLVAVRTECGTLILGVVDLRFVAVQNFPKAAALALHVAKAVEHIG